MYSDSKDNGFCYSATPVSGIFEGIIRILRWMGGVQLFKYKCEMLPRFPRDPESDVKCKY